jgi:hypothetical protein
VVMGRGRSEVISRQVACVKIILGGRVGGKRVRSVWKLFPRCLMLLDVQVIVSFSYKREALVLTSWQSSG